MPKSKRAASTSSTTKGKGSASAVSPDDKLKQQCLDLKKNIYDRWEQSIMSRNNFSPAVHRGAGSAGSVAADAVGGPSAGTTPAAATTAAAAQAVARPQVKFIAATLSDGAPVRASPSSGNVKAPTSPSLDPRPPQSISSSAESSSTPPDLSLTDSGPGSRAAPGGEGPNNRALPSKSVKPGEALATNAGEKLEEVLTTASATASQASDSTFAYESEVGVASSVDGSANTDISENSTVPPPMPLYDFLQSKMPSPTTSSGDTDKCREKTSSSTSAAQNSPITTGNNKSYSSSSSSDAYLDSARENSLLNPGMQKPPSHPRPQHQTNRPSYAAASRVRQEPNLAKAPRPKTGINVPMIWPPPEHKRWVPAQPETLHVARDRLVASMMEHDANRLLGTSKVLNRVVYDSIEAPPSMPSADADAATAAKSISGDAVADIAAGTVSAGQAEAHAAHAAATRGPQRNVGAFDGCLHGKPEDGKLKPYYVCSSAEDNTLVFESRFESGNLRRSIQVYENEYDLIVKPDINTRGHTQWFYFSVSNTRRGVPVKFNLINMYKSDSLYNRGMKPLMYSMIDSSEIGEKAAGERVGWRRCGTDVCYYQNHIKRKGGHYYTASFTVTFPHDHDTVFLAYCYPYSYSDLQAYLKGLEDDPKRRNRFRRRTMCQTLAGNNCDLLTITSFACDPESLRARKGVVVSARVHPGESNSSYMMKGVIDYLTGPSLDAKILRDNFVFKIVPMLNPDGVIVGNYRCNLAGVDLNRTWDAPSRKLNPTIFYLKQMIRRFMDDRELILFCDLHGHSRKMNVFMYGCENKKSWSLRLRERVFPRMLWRNANVFSFADCSFKVSKQKENAGRVVVWRELGLTNSYTMEASFCGADFGRYANLHFSVAEFEEMGHYFCDTILDYCDPDQSKVASTLRELQTLNPSSHTHADRVEAEDSDSGSDAESKPQVKVKRSKRRGGSSSSRATSTSAVGGSSSGNSSSSSSSASSSSSSSGGNSGGSRKRRSKKRDDSSVGTAVSVSGGPRRQRSSSATSTTAKDGTGVSKGGRKASRGEKGAKGGRRRKSKQRDGEPLSVDEAFMQADAALSKAAATRHLAGSGSAAVKARKSLR